MVVVYGFLILKYLVTKCWTRSFDKFRVASCLVKLYFTGIENYFVGYFTFLSVVRLCIVLGDHLTSFKLIQQLLNGCFLLQSPKNVYQAGKKKQWFLTHVVFLFFFYYRMSYFNTCRFAQLHYKKNNLINKWILHIKLIKICFLASICIILNS